MLRCSKRDAAYDQTGPHGVLVVDGCTLTAGPSDGYIYELDSCKCSNEDVFINALRNSAVVCEGGEGRWNSAMKASKL